MSDPAQVQQYFKGVSPAWDTLRLDEKRAACETIEPLDLDGCIYQPDIDACMKTGWKTWGVGICEPEER